RRSWLDLLRWFLFGRDRIGRQIFFFRLFLGRWRRRRRGAGRWRRSLGLLALGREIANRSLRDADILATRAVREVLAVIRQCVGGRALRALRLREIEVGLAVAVVGGLLEIEDRHRGLAGADEVIADTGLGFGTLRALLEGFFEC